MIIDAILWIGVGVFGATSLIALAYLVGLIRGPYQKLLVGTLITQVVIVSLSAYSSYIRDYTEREIRLPVSKLMIIEQAPPLTIYDGSVPIYLRSPDVSRDHRFVDLAIDLRKDFTTARQVRLLPGGAQTLSIEGRRYRMAVTQLGVLDADPNEQQAPTGDFGLLSIEREN
jgi:hypothetical protein